jgi:tetratricopeptide (TPR) repeat protein
LGAFLFLDIQSPNASEFAEARRHQRAGRINEAFALYQSLEGSDPGGVWGCKAMWEEASMRYSVANQTKEAVGLLEAIINSCGDLGLVGQALVLLADIYEFAMQDLDTANELRLRYLGLTKNPDGAHETRFKMADAEFKAGHLAQAQAGLESLLRLEPSPDLAVRASLRLGAIAQLQGDYERSIDHFQSVIANAVSPEFRLEAQLGIVESYEYLNEIEKAIAVAITIDAPAYAVNLKSNLLTRLKAQREP